MRAMDTGSETRESNEVLAPTIVLSQVSVVSGEVVRNEFGRVSEKTQLERIFAHRLPASSIGEGEIAFTQGNRWEVDEFAFQQAADWLSGAEDSHIPTMRPGNVKVIEGRDRQTDSTIAIKLLDPQVFIDEVSRDRALREITALEIMKGAQNTVQLLDFTAVSHRGTVIPIIVMTHEKPVPKNLSPQEVVNVCRGIAHSLDEAFQRGIIHRDVKPDNFLINNQGEGVLADFGLTEILDETMTSEFRRAMVELEGFVGTSMFVPPEGVRHLIYPGDYSAGDHRSDQHGLAVAAYLMLGGNREVFEPSRMFLSRIPVHSEEQQTLIENERIMGEVLEVLSKGSAYNPDDRYDSNRELVEKLEEALQKQGKI